MQILLLVMPFIVLTVLCWGIYGPVLHVGQEAMGHSSLRPFVCVGVAYFIVAVVAPLLALRTRGEEGRWSIGGAFWSLAAGAAGALGALGIIVAFQNRGQPVYVMPLVFGGAPVVNTLVTMFMNRSYRDASPVFYAGIVMVALGAAGVLFFKPGPRTINIIDLSIREFATVVVAIVFTALCWGAYGPFLHKGQMKMGGSRLRPFLCVGLAYFGIAVVVPFLLLSVWNEGGQWSAQGIVWSLAAGAAGAIGALGIILGFDFGGKPIYVMPLVFGGAPVVNTMTTLAVQESPGDVPFLFYVSLILVIAGAVTVLVCAPRGKPKEGEPRKPKQKVREKPEPQEVDAPETRWREQGDAAQVPAERTPLTPPEDPPPSE